MSSSPPKNDLVANSIHNRNQQDIPSEYWEKGGEKPNLGRFWSLGQKMLTF